MHSKDKNLIKNALIIGGSNGIGAAIATELLKGEIDNLYIADIEKPIINDSKIKYRKTDLRYDNLSNIVFDIDTLIITAGVGRLAFFEDLHDADIDKSFKINTISAIALIKKYYSKLVKKDNFNIVVMSSITGLIASPMYSVYSATKAALHKFIEAINAELFYKDTNNRILEVAPGYIKGTKFHGKDNDLAQLSKLAKNIIDAMLNKECLLIPQYDETYKNVIERYCDNPSEFAISSLEYKLKNNTIHSKKVSRIGYLSGTFDLFHIGHLNLLKRAKEHCDYLIVGVHPDASHKGGKEIFIPLAERMEVLRSVRYVDEVIECPSEDVDAYNALKYDYLFVGSDYKGTERFNRYEEFFKNTNTQIIYFPYTNTTSSTQIRKAIEINNRK